MSNKLENSLTKFEAEQEIHESDSVFDFLYVDHSRIKTFLSQFNDFGGLASITRGRSAERGKSDDSSLKTEASALVVKGSGDYKTTTKAGYSESDEKTYDPLWVNTLNFLDQIDERGLLNRDISGAGFGELVLIKGPLSITDYSTLEKTWSMASFRAAVEAGVPDHSQANRADRRRNSKKNSQQRTTSNPYIDMFFELASVLPHTIQLRIGQLPMAWGVLSPEGLVAASSDFVLKFGGPIPGDWVAIGIMDAVPDHVTNPDVNYDVSDLDQVASVMLGALEPLIRQFLGRPSTAYGITPLAVFREVGARSSRTSESTI